MDAILLTNAVVQGKWRLHVVSPWVRRGLYSIAAVATLGCLLGLLVMPHSREHRTVLVVGIAFCWSSALLAPVWNRYVIRRLFNQFAPTDDRSPRAVYAFFELFFLAVLPYILVVQCFHIWRAEA